MMFPTCITSIFNSFIHIYFVLAHDSGRYVAVVALYPSAPYEAVGVRPIECAVRFHFNVAFTRCLRYLQVHHRFLLHNYLLRRWSTCSMYRRQVHTVDGIVRCYASSCLTGCRGFSLSLPLSMRLSLYCSSSTSTNTVEPHASTLAKIVQDTSLL